MAGGVSYGYPNAAAEEDMGEQQTFAGLAWSGKKKQTRREQFLAEMNAVIPWAELRALIVPHYPTGAGGRRAMPLEAMLRIYFLQHWYDLSDPAAEDALYDSEAMRRFVGLELGEETIPDETTILHFRHLLERHRLTEEMFAWCADCSSSGDCCSRAGRSWTRRFSMRRARRRTRRTRATPR